MRRAPSALAVALLLCACAPEADLKQELEAMAQGLQGRVEPLPAIRPHEGATFGAVELPDPFHPALPRESEAARRDRVLLATYSSASDLERAREAALAEAKLRIAEGEEGLARLKAQLETMEKAAKARGGKPLASVEADLSAARVAIKAAEASLDVRRKSLAEVDVQFDEEKKRYAELSAARAKTPKK